MTADSNLNRRYFNTALIALAAVPVTGLSTAARAMTPEQYLKTIEVRHQKDPYEKWIEIKYEDGDFYLRSGTIFDFLSEKKNGRPIKVKVVRHEISPEAKAQGLTRDALMEHLVERQIEREKNGVIARKAVAAAGARIEAGDKTDFTTMLFQEADRIKAD